MAPLLDTAARVISHPVGQQALAELIRVTGQWYLTRRAPKEESITDRLMALVQQQQEQITRLLEGSGYEVQRAETQVVEAGDTTPGPTGETETVSTGCIPCTSAHLAATAAILEEALRFARADPRGPLHPQALRRIQTAKMEITNLEREDLRPDNVSTLPVAQRELVRQYIPKIRELRQRIVNGIRDTESLEQVAAEAETLFRAFDRDTGPLGASGAAGSEP